MAVQSDAQAHLKDTDIFCLLHPILVPLDSVTRGSMMMALHNFSFKLRFWSCEIQSLGDPVFGRRAVASGFRWAWGLAPSGGGYES